MSGGATQNSNTTSTTSEAADTRQNGSLHQGRNAFLNPGAKTFTPGADAPSVAHRTSPAPARAQCKNEGQQVRGRGRGSVSRALGNRDRPPTSSTAAAEAAEPGQQEDAVRPVAGGAGGGRTGRASANHLLNFQYGERSSRGGRAGRGGATGTYQQPRRRFPAPRPHKYDRNKFLQANFRFLVADTVDVAAFSADADKMFDWDDVVQVEMMSAVPIQCPISLDSPPICPQITPCGHVFGFPSIMQHLVHHGGEKLLAAGPCPLCFRPLVARDLRLVQVRQVQTPKVGDAITFQLLRRPRSTIVPEPVVPGLPPGRLLASIAAGTVSGSSNSSCSTGASAASGSAWTSQRSGGGGEQQQQQQFLNPLDMNQFAKFATIGDALPLWKAAAVELAEHAASVTAEGGLEAAIEAPFIYSSLDSLAARAKKWTEQRALVLEGAGQLPAGSSVDSMAREAEQAVKRLFTAAVQVVQDQMASETKIKELHEEFPALAASSPPPQPPASALALPAAPPPGLPSAPAASRARPVAPAVAGSASSSSSSSQPPALPPPQQQQQQQQQVLMQRAADEEPATQFEFEAAFSEDGHDAGQEQEDEEDEVDAARASAAAEAAALHASPGSSLEGLPPSEAGLQGLLGSSAGSRKVSTAAAAPAGELYLYQAQSGQWYFMDPLNVRCLLQHYGSYEDCPDTLAARIIELEDVVQSEASRKRLKLLSHLPLTGDFKLCEVDLAQLLPPQALQPFAEELGQRERRRRRRAAEERRQSAREAAAARAAAEARRGPSESELRNMPLPAATLNAAGDSELADLDESLAIQMSLEDAAAAAGMAATSQPAAGVSFAAMTKLGFGASGPALGAASSLPLGSSPPAAAPRGAWAVRSGPAAGAPKGPAAATAQAPTGAWAAPRPAPGAAASGGGAGAAAWGPQRSGPNDTGSSSAAAAGAGAGEGEAGGGSRKGKKLVLFSTTQRRY